MSSIWTGASVARRYGYAIAIAVFAVTAQWLIYPVAHARAPFLFVLPCIVLATALGGRGPGFLIAVAGLLNAAMLQDPVGSLLVAVTADRFAILAYALTGTLTVLISEHFRAASRQELGDLHELHELSVTLATLPAMQEQLDVLLRTLARMHGSDLGLVSIYDPDAEAVSVGSSLGFSNAGLERLRLLGGGEGACGMACVERRRIIIADTEAPSFAPLRDFARTEGFRAVHSTPILGHAGEVFGAISVHFRIPRRPTEREMRLADICANKAAFLLERGRAEKRAARHDHRFRVVLEASAVPFTIMTPVRNDLGVIVDFLWTYANAAAARALGYTREELAGQRLQQRLTQLPQEAELFALYVSVIEKNAAREHEFGSGAAGMQEWRHVIASPLEGSVAVWFAQITERKRLEETLREADRRKDEFLAVLAHELRNPLAPIRQAAMIARKDSATDAQKRWGYAVIERQVQHMSLLLEDLLDVSRIARGTLHLRKQSTDLQSIVSVALETARPVIESRHHRLVVELPPDLKLEADPLRLAQVFANLLTNAAKYTQPQGVIRFAAELVGEELIVRVADNGIGIAAEDLRGIFRMFAQVRSAQEQAQGGLGIGLALTKGLVEMHGGTIEATSPGPGKGSTFTVRLAAAEKSAAPSGRPCSQGERRPALSKRILVADDNRDAAESLAVLLRLEGHDVLLAHDGDEALRALAQSEAEVALLDLGMPRMTGYEVARRIRDSGNSCNVLLIAITGWGQESDRERARAAGFDHHLTKPIDIDQLLRLLRSDDSKVVAAP